MHRFVVAALLSLIAAPVMNRVAAQTTGRIEGRVVDEQKRPIAGAIVTIVVATVTTIQSRTDATGNYVLDSIPAGIVEIRARAIGRKPVDVAGVRVTAGTTRADFNFTLQPSTITLTEISPTSSVNGGMLLRFQLIRPTTTATTDPAIAGIDSVLRDLFHWRGYRLLSEAAIVVDVPGNSFFPGRPAYVKASQLINADGYPYTISVVVDSTSPSRVRLTVDLTGGLSSSRQDAKTLFSTTVTMTLGHTVVLGNAQPGGTGAKTGDVNRTVILTVKPELRTP
jgi:hypothetical protein